jgi:replicative DNA helicase
MAQNDFWPIKKIFDVANDYKPSKEVFPCGFERFDKAMDGGFRGGELVTISGQTGQGKTLFAQCLACNFDKIKVPSLWFSYEMNPWYLKERFVKMGKGSEMLAYSPIKLIENTFEFLNQNIELAKSEFACKIIFIDHLHYLVPLSESHNNISFLVGGIVRELKKMAVSHDVIIFLIAHTKKVYQAEKLDLSSIRDSSLVAQESDYVYLVERQKKEQGKLDTSDTEWTNQTKISLAKNRRTGIMNFITCEFKDNNLIPITNFYGEPESFGETPFDD